MSGAVDLGPATAATARVVTAIRDDQLAGPTPCQDMTVGQLLVHVDGLCQAFAQAAVKSTALNVAPSLPDAFSLGTDWRERIAGRLSDLAEAWGDPAAWDGFASAGGVEMPAPVAGRVALNEVVVHGWDLARATCQAYDADDTAVAAASEFVDAAVAESPGGTPGLFGPPVPVTGGAAPLERLVGATGRDPAWRLVG